MSLTKQDLKEIKTIVNVAVERSADDVTRNLSDKIDNTTAISIACLSSPQSYFRSKNFIFSLPVQ